MTSTNGHEVLLPSCPACKRAIQSDAETTFVQDEKGQQVTLHELCFLRIAYAKEQRDRILAGHVLGAVLHRLGGSLRIHRADIEASLQAGGVKSEEEPGGFVSVWVGERRRVVLATSMPTEKPH